jgi:alpha-ketoglutarate-dependent taurine dioxygenase
MIEERVQMNVPVAKIIDDIVAVVDGAELPGLGDFAETSAWAEQSKEEVRGLLTTHGAVLFRNFPVAHGDEFAAFARIFAGDLRQYIEGNSPRTAISNNIYTSTEYPAKYRITMHNELSYSRWWPRFLYFYCEIPADEGGATLLAPGTVPFDLLDSGTLSQYRSAGVAYVQNLHGGDGAGRSWQQTFETEDRDQVERYLVEGGAEPLWKRDGGLRISQRRPAVRCHPDTGTELWFNQVDQWHPSNLDERTREALDLVYAPEDLPLNAFHGDGSPLDEKMLGVLRDGYAAAATPVRWQARDLLVMDNMLLAHGRAPYSGPRRVLVGMA